ncbi:MAG: hypothetical protein BWX99_01991 [Deltaproteobacteria bacterium ADurb.Bin151]|jgi:hypothetical protein|nr:MAG: hypothetical protein BWX99_01991 [Deltaproteobacteria bacterium ADurb.Bin151]
MGKLSIVQELWSYLKVRKKWWLFPILLFLLIIGTLLVLAEGSVVAPLIYTLF